MILQPFKILLFFIFILVLTQGCAESVPRAPQKLTLGIVEEVDLTGLGMSLDAKLDTGADTSSLHADDIEIFQKNSKKKYVRFYVITHAGKMRKVELPLERQAKIKRKLGGVQIRPVVLMEVCLGGIAERVEFTLVDRSNFEYPVLIGRNFLSGNIIVDSSRSFTQPPACAEEIN